MASMTNSIMQRITNLEKQVKELQEVLKDSIILHYLDMLSDEGYKEVMGGERVRPEFENLKISYFTNLAKVKNQVDHENHNRLMEKVLAEIKKTKKKIEKIKKFDTESSLMSPNSLPMSPNSLPMSPNSRLTGAAALAALGAVGTGSKKTRGKKKKDGEKTIKKKKK